MKGYLDEAAQLRQELAQAQKELEQLARPPRVRGMELLAPAGGPEAARAAVQNGADAVYLGYTYIYLAETIAYCRRAGGEGARHRQHPVDRPGAGRAAGGGGSAGRRRADAVIVQDLGAARAWPPGRPTCRGTPSTQMTIHSLDGAKMLEELGFFPGGAGPGA